MNEKRRLAAEVLLHRRLRNLQRIDEDREIDLEFITCAEYQLFLDDKRAEGKYFQPDHWTDYTFPKGMAREPIAGVRAEDAEEFCKWLSKFTGDKYRLPTLDEFEEYPTDDLGTWCKEEESFFSILVTNNNKKELYYKELKTIHTKLPLLFNFETTFSRSIVNYILVLDNGGLNRAINRAIKFKSKCDFKLIFDLTFDFASVDFIQVKKFSINLERNLELIKNIDENIYTAMKTKNYQTAKKLIQDMQSESNLYKQRQGNLLYELFTIIILKTDFEVRMAWRKYLLKLSEYAWIGYEELEKEYKPSWWQRLLGRKPLDYNKEKQAILNLYWWLQIIILREQGKLPAWEGIRIVRDKS